MRTLVPADHPALHTEAAPIAPESIATPHIQELIADMRAILAEEPLGVAIAAPQVGEALQLFMVGSRALIAPEEEDTPENEEEAGEPAADMVCINPEIIKTSRKVREQHEGCLSLPGLWGLVPRAEKVTLRYLDETGALQTRGASGLLAHIFQHECDHLHGTLYTEKATRTAEDPDTLDA